MIRRSSFLCTASAVVNTPWMLPKCHISDDVVCSAPVKRGPAHLKHLDDKKKKDHLIPWPHMCQLFVFKLQRSAALQRLKPVEEPLTGIMWQTFKSLLLRVRRRMARTERRFVWSPPAVFPENTRNIWNGCDELDESELPQPLQASKLHYHERFRVIFCSFMTAVNEGALNEFKLWRLVHWAAQMQILSGTIAKVLLKMTSITTCSFLHHGPPFRCPKTSSGEDVRCNNRPGCLTFHYTHINNRAGLPRSTYSGLMWCLFQADRL